MRGTRSIIAIGVIVLVIGMIFHLQGQSVIGPETSFMYSNPDWVSYGIQIIIAGSFIIGIGIIINYIKTKRLHGE